MTDKPGRVWGVIQEWLDARRAATGYKPPSQNELAPKFGVSTSSLTEYKYARTMPPPHFVVLAAREMQVPYERLLAAVLEDHGYQGESLELVRAALEDVARGAPAKRPAGISDEDWAEVQQHRQQSAIRAAIAARRSAKHPPRKARKAAGE